MGQYMPLIIGIVIIAIVVFVVERRWRAEKTEAAPVEPALETKTGYATRVTDGVKGLRNRVLPGKQTDLPKQFQSWAADALAEQKALQSWLTALPAAEATSFTEQLAAFCNELNLDLSWLVQKKLTKDPTIEQAAKAVVVDYCQACYEAAQAQADFKAFGTFQAMIQNPKGHRALSQALFTQLVNQKLAEPVTPDLFLAPEDKRQAHMMEVISQVAEQNREQFITVLKEVLAAEKAAEAANSAATKSWTARIPRPFQKSEPAPVVEVEEAKPASTAAA